jgi:NADP-dependent 3-hydroxy acid dehydrogenase YdfG
LQRIIIIRATSGIGRALAKLYAEAGNRVGIIGRREELLESLRAENPDRFVPKRLDVTEIESISEKLDQLAKELGGLDLLIISSGTGELNPTLDFAVERPTLETNVFGFTAVAELGVPVFREAGNRAFGRYHVDCCLARRG